MLREAHNGAPIQGCGQHLVCVVERAEGVLVLAEVGVLQTMRLREVGVEEIEEVLVGLLGHKDEACLKECPSLKVKSEQGGVDLKGRIGPAGSGIRRLGEMGVTGTEKMGIVLSCMLLALLSYSLVTDEGIP